MPATPLTCVSIGSATVAIAVLALAPGYLVVTEIVGGTTLGYCEIGSRTSETRPIRTKTSASTLERTGRSMKKRENMCCRQLVSRREVHRGSMIYADR